MFINKVIIQQFQYLYTIFLLQQVTIDTFVKHTKGLSLHKL